MRKLLSLLALGLMCVQAMAIPAIRKPANMSGTGDVTVRLHGDEFFNYYTTDDGYTVLRNQQGGWEYARPQNGGLVATGVAAHDAGKRSAQELQLLADVGKNSIDEVRLAEARQLREQLRQEAQKRARFNYNRFRGLIILVEYNDLSFEMSNPQEFYNHMVNDENYTGYTLNGRNVICPGSVRDYYRDQSNGLFNPVFDVVGPVKVDYNSTSHRQTSNTASIFMSAMKAVNSQVDFSLYDGDNDGNIDLVFFIGAGPASSYEGNNSNLLWPHQSSFSGLQTLFTRFDGKKPANYACCTEVYGWQDNPSSLETQGIGVICHEFSHVLGLKDHYDSDYSSSGGESLAMGEWDVMDAGASLNVARTPAAYTLFERWSLGWCNPTVIDHTGEYTLTAIDGTSDGYILKSPDNKEYFTLENRQNNTKWDRHLPGHGMLITRVDSTSTSPWSNNKVNANPNHQYLELLRAWSQVTTSSQDSDPFPGSRHITAITNTTTPNLKTWSGKKNSYYITRIREKNRVISFHVATEGSETKFVETFEKMPLGLESDVETEGDFSMWMTHNATIENHSQSKRVAMKSLSAVFMTQPMYYDMYQVDVDITNPSSTAKFSLYYSLDWGENWILLPTSSGEASVTVEPNTTVKPVWFVDFDNSQPVCYLLAMIAGSEVNPVYIDNISVYYTGEEGIPEPSNRKLIETFENLPVSLASNTESQGDIAKWQTDNATIADYADSHQVELTLSSAIETTTPLYYNMLQVTAQVSNPQPSVALLQLFSSIDGGATWVPINTFDGNEQFEVGANTDAKGRWNVGFANDQPVLYRLAMVGGAENAPCYVDNFTVFYTGEPGHTDLLLGDLNGDGNVDVTDVSLAIDLVLGKEVAIVPGAVTDINGDGNLDVSDVSLLIDIVLGKG